MSTTITMPQLGETVTEGTVAQWLKRVGDAIDKYEAFVEISTDKVNAEVPSPVSGVLTKIIVAAGETVPTGAPIAIIEEVAAATAGPPESIAGDGSPVRSVPVATNGATVAAPVPASYGAPAGGAHENGIGRNGRMSPAVRRLAREHRIDVTRLRGTGGDGRVTAQDVLAAATLESPRAAAGATAIAEPETIVVSAAALPDRPEGRSTYAAPVPGTLVPLTPARKLIAQRMTESLASAPHAWTMVEVDVTKLMAWRAHEKERFLREKGYPLTLLPFFIAAVVQALRAHPLVNSRFTEQGIVVERDLHIGIAIGLESNLVVPVIRDADGLSIAGLAVAAGKLIERARNGKLTAAELGGGTFTVNNTGANGSVMSKPIINAGQAAIVTMETVVKRAVVVDDAIAIRAMMNVCLSLDHRVLDGTSASAFLGDLRERLAAMDAHDAL